MISLDIAFYYVLKQPIYNDSICIYRHIAFNVVFHVQASHLAASGKAGKRIPSVGRTDQQPLAWSYG